MNTNKTLRGMMIESDASLTADEQAIKIAIDELAGWCRQYLPLLQGGAAIGFKIGVSEDLASALEAGLPPSDAEQVVASLLRV